MQFTGHKPRLAKQRISRRFDKGASICIWSHRAVQDMCLRKYGVAWELREKKKKCFVQVIERIKQGYQYVLPSICMEVCTELIRDTRYRSFARRFSLHAFAFSKYIILSSFSKARCQPARLPVVVEQGEQLTPKYVLWATFFFRALVSWNFNWCCCWKFCAVVFWKRLFLSQAHPPFT